MEHFDVAMGLLQQGNTYLLQLRNGAQQAGGLNLIGCFGGKVEAGETAIEAACREVREESTHKPREADAELLGTVHVVSERHDKPITVAATIYRFMIPKGVPVAAREGTLKRMTEKEIRANLDTLTTATRACFEELLKKG